MTEQEIAETLHSLRTWPGAGMLQAYLKHMADEAARELAQKYGAVPDVIAGRLAGRFDAYERITQDIFITEGVASFGPMLEGMEGIKL